VGRKVFSKVALLLAPSPALWLIGFVQEESEVAAPVETDRDLAVWTDKNEVHAMPGCRWVKGRV
jgi:hypothetical protein